MIYCDSSAVVKLVVEERFSSELTAFLKTGSSQISSELMRTEVLRGIARYSPQALPRAREAAGRFALLSVSTAILDVAGRLQPAYLRTLDAIHIATALAVQSELEAFVSYDDRQLEAASALGLPVLAPGR